MASGPYKQAVLKPRVPVWHAKVDPGVRISRGEAIRKKLEAIYKSSATDKPICMRCDGIGHKARECKNGLLCFACNQLGHRAIHYKNVRTLSPRTSPDKSTLHALHTVHLPPTAPPSSYRVLSSKPDLKASAEMAQYKTPIFTFARSATSIALENDFVKSFILDDIAGWGPERVERELKKFRPRYQWVVTVFDEFKYMIKAPTVEWMEEHVGEGTITLDGTVFPTVMWHPGFGEGMKLASAWVRV